MGVRHAGYSFGVRSADLDAEDVDADTVATDALTVGRAGAGGTLTLDGSAREETYGPEHWFYGRNGSWLARIDVANALKSRDFAIAVDNDYYVDDGGTTNGSPTLTSTAQGGFISSSVGAAVSGAGIPVGTTIIAVASATSCTMSANATATASGVRVHVTQSGMRDQLYLKHRGRRVANLGIGTTPNDNFRVQIAASDAENTLGGLSIRVGSSQTADALVVHDSNGNANGKKWWVNSSFYMEGPASFGVRIQAEGTDQRALVMANSDRAVTYGFDFTGSGASQSARLKYFTGAVTFLQLDTDGGFKHVSSKLGFYNATPATKPTITGSRGGNAALASLLTAGATLGLWTDSTTA